MFATADDVRKFMCIAVFDILTLMQNIVGCPDRIVSRFRFIGSGMRIIDAKLCCVSAASSHSERHH